MAYSNVDMQKIQENSPRAAENATFMQQAAAAGNVKIGTLANAAGPSQSAFVNKIRAKQEEAAQPGAGPGGAAPAGGMFGQYKINEAQNNNAPASGKEESKEP